MNENNADLMSEKPYDGAEGFAVKLDGKVAIRTASSTETGARINGLCLFFGVPPLATGNWTDEQIYNLWAKAEKETTRLGREVSIVKVECVEV